MTASVRSDLVTARRERALSGGATATASLERLLVVVIGVVWASTLVVDFRVALTVLMALGFAVAAVGLRYPRLGVVGIGMLCTLNEIAAPLLLSGGLWRWNTLSYWLLLVTMVYWRHALRLEQPQTRLLVAFILLLGLGIVVSPDPADGVQGVFAVVAVFGLSVYFRRVAFDPEAWYWLGVVSGVLAAGGTTAFLLQQDSLPHVNANAWPYLPLTAMLAICLAFVVERASGRRLVLVVLALVNGVWVFLSGSRGDLLIAAMSFAFLLAMLDVRRAVLFGIVAALVGIVLLSNFTTLQNRAITRFHLLTDTNQPIRVRTSGRFDLALGGWYIFTEHPLGVGSGGFRSAWANLGPREGLSRFKQWQSFPAHSAWVKVLAENGLLGVLLLAAYVVSFVVTAWRSRDRDLRRLGVMVAAVLAAAWLTTELQHKALWFLAAGSAILLDRTSVWRWSDSVNGGLRA